MTKNFIQYFDSLNKQITNKLVILKTSIIDSSEVHISELEAENLDYAAEQLLYPPARTPAVPGVYPDPGISEIPGSGDWEALQDLIDANLVLINNLNNYILFFETDTSVTLTKEYIETTTGYVTEYSDLILLQEKIIYFTNLKPTISALSASFNRPNNSNLTSYECPTRNDIYAKYEVYTAILMQYSESYKNKDELNKLIGYLNVPLLTRVINLDKTNYLEIESDINNYYNIVNTRMNFIINTMQPDISEYFVRLRALMTKLKIADKKVKNDYYLDLLETRSVPDKNDILTYADVYFDNDMDTYISYKQDLMYQIKINDYIL